MNIAEVYEATIKNFIDTFRELKPVRKETIDLQKKIVKSLELMQETLKIFLIYAMSDGMEEALHEVDDFFRENYMEGDQLLVGDIQDIIKENFLDDIFLPKESQFIHFEEADQSNFNIKEASDIASKNKLVD